MSDTANAPAAAKSEPLLVADNLTAGYIPGVNILNDCSLELAQGELVGVIGPNGAGKSTLVKIMLTVVRPTRARGTILGRPIGHQATLRRVGYLPEKHRFPIYQTGRQAIEFAGAMSQVDAKTCRNKAAEAVSHQHLTQPTLHHAAP